MGEEPCTPNVILPVKHAMLIYVASPPVVSRPRLGGL